MRNKFVNILESVAMVFGSSGVSVYAEETPAPLGSPAVTDTTLGAASATPEASSSPVSTPSATPESTPAASAESKPEETARKAELSPANEIAYGDEGYKFSFNDTTKTVKNGTADNTETFHDVGTYTVIVKQSLADEQMIDENWNYDKSFYTITYTVTRDGNNLSEMHVITDSEGNVVEKIVFHNTQNDPKPSWTVLSGTVMIDNEKRVKQDLDPINSFEVDMYDENGVSAE